MRWRGELIKREFDIMRGVSHPFIVKLVAAFSDNRDYNFVVEYCAGGTLYELIRKYKQLPLRMALYYFCEMLLALEYLHSRNIIFRDIKAENILVDHLGHLRLTDFGLAQQLESRDHQVNSFCGSPIYIAPETIEKVPYDVRVDFYALGVLLYEMITGTPPFINRDTEVLKKLKLQGSISYPSTMHPVVKTIVDKCAARVARTNLESRLQVRRLQVLLRTTESTGRGPRGGLGQLQGVSFRPAVVQEQAARQRRAGRPQFFVR